MSLVLAPVQTRSQANLIGQMQIFGVRSLLGPGRNPSRWSLPTHTGGWEPAQGQRRCGKRPRCGAFGGRRATHQKGRGPEGSRGFPRALANCALIIVARARQASVRTKQAGPGRGSLLCWASPSSLGCLASFLCLFFSACDICSVLVPPVIPYPSQLCRPRLRTGAWSALSIRPF